MMNKPAAKNVSDLHALLEIIMLVQSGGPWTPSKLAAHFGLHERTIFRYIKKLNGVGVPIYFDRSRYRLRGSFFMQPIQLSAEEALALAALRGLLAKEDQIPMLKPAYHAMAKIEAQLPGDLREQIARIEDHVVVRTAAPASQEGFEDIYEAMRGAIASRRGLRCEYETARNRTEDSFGFEPYALFYNQRAWYVIGRHLGRRGELRSLKLSRFLRAEPTGEPYDIPAGFTLEKHFGNAWRMIRGERDCEVVLRFDASVAETVADTRWHHTQESQAHEDGSVTLSFTVSGFDEIVWWVLSYGPHCRVVRPAELAERVKSLAAATAALYEEDSGRAKEPGAGRRGVPARPKAKGGKASKSRA